MLWCSFYTPSAIKPTPSCLRADAAAPGGQHHPRPSGERSGGGTAFVLRYLQIHNLQQNLPETRRSIRCTRTAWTRMDTHRRALSRNFLPKLGAALCEWSLTCKTNCDLRPKFHIQPNSPASVHTAAPAGLSRPRPWLCCLRRLDRLLFCLEVRGNPAADSGSVRGGYIIRSGSVSPLEFAKETPSKVDVPITISSFIL